MIKGNRVLTARPVTDRSPDSLESSRDLDKNLNDEAPSQELSCEGALVWAVGTNAADPDHDPK